ncbi:MAG: hypothetical protein DI629_13170 [Mesorhizobium amorphae]|nr:MAG: hypothetical protein DI629_13170 [Mesorhizobium amorphae]
MTTLRAVLDRIIPADEWPSATQAGVDRFVLALWRNGSDTSEAETLAGFAALDALAQETASESFAGCSEALQDAMLAAFTEAPWFRHLCELAAEGFYANPANGANPDAASWRMVGYRHGLPEGPDGPPADPTEARIGRLWA